MNRRAQSLVEFALIAPGVILLAMLAWDGGTALREQVVLQQAARDGARAAATAYGGATLTVVQNAVTASAGRDLPGLQVTSPYLTVSNPDAQSVKVQLQYTHALITPVMRQLWGGNFTISASATFYLPQLTATPATVVPSTPLPTATPTPTPSPTPTITPTVTPTPSAIGPCWRPFTFATMPAGTGYFVTLRLTATSDIFAAWGSSEGESSMLSIYLYRGIPLGGTSGASGMSPPGGALASGSGSGGAFINSLGMSLGTYTVYFYKPAPSGLTQPSFAVIAYQSGTCS